MATAQGTGGARGVGEAAARFLRGPWRRGDSAAPQRRRSLGTAPLQHRIIALNLLALTIFAVGILRVGPYRESLLQSHAQTLLTEARLVAGLVEARLGAVASAGSGSGRALDRAGLLDGLGLPADTDAFLSSRAGGFLDSAPARPAAGAGSASVAQSAPDRTARRAEARRLAGRTPVGHPRIATGRSRAGSTTLSALAPVTIDGQVLGSVVLAGGAGGVDRLVQGARAQVLRMFLLASLVSVGLSLLLASRIAMPLAALAAAADPGDGAGGRDPGGMRIPDLSRRSDEIGQLSRALRGMVAALHDRIDANERFAADVAHEIRNPLASLRSAVGTMRLADRPEQRARLLDVIDHDQRRLERLVGEISCASRLDTELVREEQAGFDLLALLGALAAQMADEAGTGRVELLHDFPAEGIRMRGLEARLAQVFRNLLANAISFCRSGDTVRIRARRREARVVVAFEDTGPGIPEEALDKIFQRFYSERPASEFGDHSGLGLAISRQIVEAHGGSIHAENIRPGPADITSEPMGARLVVDLPG